MEVVWGVEEVVTEAGGDSVEASLAAFRRELEEGFGKIGSAAEHLKGVTTAMESAGQRLESSLETHRDLQAQSSSAVQEARSLLAEMRDINDQARAARAETMETRDNVLRMVGELTTLTNDLRARIAALAVLARPLDLGDSLEATFEVEEEVEEVESEPAYV